MKILTVYRLNPARETEDHCEAVDYICDDGVGPVVHLCSETSQLSISNGLDNVDVCLDPDHINEMSAELLRDRSEDYISVTPFR